MMERVTTYRPAPIALTHGSGVWVFDEENHKYFDSFCGIAVTGLGHAHPIITQTIQQQAARILHTSNAFHIRQQEELAERLCRLSQMDQVFFANSGAEANEAAIKLARLYAHQQQIENPKIIVMERAFHGRTLATLSASGNRKIQAGFEPLVSGFIRVPFNDIQAIQQVAEHHSDVVAVLVEPIQGEAGIYCMEESYLRALHQLCHQNQWLLMLDEVQTGNARTGHYFYYLGTGILPDVVTTAKGLGNGVPIGACLMSQRAINLFQPGKHGSTFGGNPLACATALSVLDVIEQENICLNAHERGLELKQALWQKLQGMEQIVAIRGMGLMLGIEFNQSIEHMKAQALNQGLLVNVTAEKVLRLLPPLIMTPSDVDDLVARISKTITSSFEH